MMGRERPRLRSAKSVPERTSGVTHAPLSVPSISPAAAVVVPEYRCTIHRHLRVDFSAALCCSFQPDLLHGET